MRALSTLVLWLAIALFVAGIIVALWGATLVGVRHSWDVFLIGWVSAIGGLVGLMIWEHLERDEDLQGTPFNPWQ